MKITITPREAFDRDMWTQLCDLTGINMWAVNEGLMEMDKEIDLTEEQAKELGII